MLVLDREHVRQAGATDAARQAVSFLTRPGGPPDGFWIHLDADVFDETIMRSVDDPTPTGLTPRPGIGHPKHACPLAPGYVVRGHDGFA
jgi:arginase family enzyme